MKISIMTLFPEMCETFLNESIIGRARKKNLFEVESVNIRDFAGNKHNKVDDSPYGGGMGMVMQAEPIYRCYLAVADLKGDIKYEACKYLEENGYVIK